MKKNLKQIKRNGKYWNSRLQVLETTGYNKSIAYYKDVQNQFQQAINDIETDIRKWYQRLADNNDISYAAAQRILNKNELKEFQWSINQYISYGQKHALNKRLMKQLENASAKTHINRLESMKLQINYHVQKLFAEYEKNTCKFLRKSYEDRYYHTAYEIAKGTQVATSLQKLDTTKINVILTKPWANDEKVFSSRIWEDKEKLIQNLHTELTQQIIRGSPPDKAIQTLTKKMECAKSNARRLILTESAAISSLATNQSYVDLDIEKYEILATLDKKTSDICQKLDGKQFYLKDYKVGLTAPPFHPYCRSTTVPVFDSLTENETRTARGKDKKTYYVSASIKYKQWKKEFVEAA